MVKTNIRPLLLTLLLFLLVPAVLYASGREHKVVRVGWFTSNIDRINARGQRSGYCYDYLQSIAANTGWDYEYVDGSWPELYEQLLDGKIDLLPDVAIAPERYKGMLFSKVEMGMEEYYIVALKKHKTIRLGHPETLNGMRIGVKKGCVQAEVLRKWLDTHHIKATIVQSYYQESDYLKEMEAGHLDAVASVNVVADLDKNLTFTMARIGSSAVHFAVNKNRPDLKQELDKAMENIFSYNEYYNRDLHDMYFHNNVEMYLTPEETQWLKQHGTIRIGYRDNYLPFCAENHLTGELEGLLGDFVEKVNTTLGEYGVHVETVAYPGYMQAVEAMKRDEVDVAFPNGMTLYDTDEKGLFSTNPFVTSAEVAIVRGDFVFDADKPLRSAINNTNLNFISVVKDMYPNWELVSFPSTDECLVGIAKGEADLLLTSNYRMAVLYNRIEQLGLKTVATGSDITLSFAVNKGDNMLYSIMSRLSQVMSGSEVNTSLSKHSNIPDNVRTIDFLRTHYQQVIILLGFVCGVILVLLILSYKANRKAKLANMAKSQFLFNMSHDIRTPMNAILGYSELLEQELDDKEKSRDHLAKIRTSGRFLLELINNVLEMSRIESGNMGIDEQPHLARGIFDDVLAVFADRMKRKGIDFSFSSNVKTKAIYCDRLCLNEILLNLLSNAKKYTPEGGSVSVVTDELENRNPGCATLRCRVSDTGQGMSKDYLPHIFEDFTRERSFTDNKIYGTGLGMSIVKRLVDMMGATITVESEPGKGTTFTVTFVFRIADESLLEQHDEPEEEATVSFEGKHILMAEDNELNAEIAMEILSDEGLEVTWAKDGRECVDMLGKAAAGTYDLILMDIQMPVMNGYEATRAIRQMSDSAKAHIPIVAMTANAFAEDKANALKAGMNGHVAKPIDVPLLLQTMAEFLR